MWWRRGYRWEILYTEKLWHNFPRVCLRFMLMWPYYFLLWPGLLAALVVVRQPPIPVKPTIQPASQRRREHTQKLPFVCLLTNQATFRARKTFINVPKCWLHAVWHLNMNILEQGCQRCRWSCWCDFGGYMGGGWVVDVHVWKSTIWLKRFPGRERTTALRWMVCGR